VVKLVGSAYIRAATMKSSMNGFKKKGLTAVPVHVETASNSKHQHLDNNGDNCTEAETSSHSNYKKPNPSTFVEPSDVNPLHALRKKEPRIMKRRKQDAIQLA
jgi:hypothetical protein